MTKYHFCLAFLLFHVLATPAQTGGSRDELPSVRILEFLNDLLSAPAVVVSNCIAIEPSGKFHMELRQQRLPSHVADLKIYEGTLSISERDDLRTLATNISLKKLPTFEIPPIPETSSFIKVFRAEKSSATILFNKWVSLTGGDLLSLVKVHLTRKVSA